MRIYLPTVSVKDEAFFPTLKQWAAVTIQWGVRMEPPHQTGPWNSLKSINTCHGQDPGCAFVPPTILEPGFFLPHSTFPKDENQFRAMVHKDVFLITIKIVITITLSKSYENLRRCRIGKCKEKQNYDWERFYCYKFGYRVSERLEKGPPPPPQSNSPLDFASPLGDRVGDMKWS